jgi:hypothetical protein
MLEAASKHRWTAQLPKLPKGRELDRLSALCLIQIKLPVGHHLESLGAYSIDDLGTLTRIGDLEFLLKKYRRLLVRKFYNSRDKEMVWWGRGGVQEREEVNRLKLPVSEVYFE